jgi:hypothetical protein
MTQASVLTNAWVMLPNEMLAGDGDCWHDDHHHKAEVMAEMK